jgi:hypothetical protein
MTWFTVVDEGMRTSTYFEHAQWVQNRENLFPVVVVVCEVVFAQPRPRPSIFIIFLIFSAFSHEKTGTRWFGGGVEDGRKRKEGLADFPIRVPKTAPNLPHLDMPNYCVLKQNYLQLNSEFKPIQVK